MSTNMKNRKQIKFTVKNLGVIQEGEFEQKPLTIFCGENNTGKTWAIYCIYHFYRFLEIFENRFDRFLRGIEGKKISIAKGFNIFLNQRLSTFFNSDKEIFKESEFSFENAEEFFTDEKINKFKKKSKDNLFDEEFTEKQNKDCFLIPTERVGLHLFHRELSNRRTALLHHASRKNIDINELLNDVIGSRYPIPIGDYIDWLNKIPDLKKKKTEFHEYALWLTKNISKGNYKVSREGEVTFSAKKQKKIENNLLDLHITSGTVKSLFGLWFYLEYCAERGDTIIIDEPELNLHPSNQENIAKLFVKLINAGLKIVISTHSDYLITEINNMIMLTRDEKKQLQEKYKYEKDEILNSDDIATYIFEKNTIKKCHIEEGEGIEVNTFNEVIEKSQEKTEDIIFSLAEQNNETDD